MKRPFAVFTITRDEPFFLHLWSDYYCGVVPEEDVHVLDNGSIDRSVDDALSRHPGMQVTRVERKREHDLSWLRDTVQAFQHALLSKYEVVVFAETDEFLFTRPGTGTLRSFLDAFLLDASQKSVRAVGWNPVHQFEAEPALVPVPGQSVLQDRNSMWRLPRYDKTLVSKVPLSWHLGFHGLTDGDPPLDQNLFLFHAWTLDYDLFVKRRGWRAGPDVRKRFADRDLAGCPSSGEAFPIPDDWKALLVW